MKEKQRPLLALSLPGLLSGALYLQYALGPGSSKLPLGGKDWVLGTGGGRSSAWAPLGQIKNRGDRPLIGLIGGPLMGSPANGVGALPKRPVAARLAPADWLPPHVMLSALTDGKVCFVFLGRRPNTCALVFLQIIDRPTTLFRYGSGKGNLV